MSAVPPRHRFIACVFLIGFAFLNCAAHVAYGVTIRYNDGIISQDFTVGPNSPDSVRDLLKFLAVHGQIGPTATADSISATIITSRLKQVVGGVPFLAETPGLLATQCGFSYFNWYQTIEHVPGNMVFTTVDPSGHLLGTPTTILDPIMNYPSVRYRVTNPTNGNFGDVKLDGEWWQTNSVDNHEPYFSLNGVKQPENEDAYGYFYKNFEDGPSLGWAPQTAGGAPDYMGFFTRLVGVNSSNDVVATWDGIGTNFRWKSNSVNAEVTSYLASASGGPAIVSGGVFEVTQDFVAVPEPPALTLTATSAIVLLGWKWRRKKRGQ